MSVVSKTPNYEVAEPRFCHRPIANGVYIYKVVARSNGLKADAYGKAVVMK